MQRRLVATWEKHELTEQTPYLVPFYVADLNLFKPTGREESEGSP